MYGGADLGQLRLVLGILVVIFGSAAVITFFDTTTSPATLGEDHIIRHQPGVLLHSSHGEDASGTSQQEGILAPGGMVEMNSADATTLMILPGIGPARAQAILDERTHGGPFRNLDDLERVSGIGPKTVQRLTPYITINTEGLPPEPEAEVSTFTPMDVSPQGQGRHRIRVNIANEQELQELTRVGPVLAQRIIEDRQLRGPYRQPEDMLRVSGIGPAFIEANRHVLAFD